MPAQKKKGAVIRKSSISYMSDQSSLCEYKKLFSCQRRDLSFISGTDRHGVPTVHMECIRPYRTPKLKYAKYDYMDFYTRAASCLTLSTRSTSETLT